MYKYEIILPYKIVDCAGCPFRRENIAHEDINSNDKLSGVVSIFKRRSSCTLKDEPILVNDTVESFNGKCPLKGNCSYLEDNK